MRLCRLFLIAVALCLFAAAPLHAQEIAGQVERQKGPASRSAAGASAALTLKDAVLVGDTIETGAGARLLVRFKDASTLTLGENARMVIDEMVYDPQPNSATAERQAVRIFKGVFQYVSGAIGKGDPLQVALSTPVATIGIRGTTFVGGELTVGMPPGQPHYGFQINDGAIEVVTPLGTALLDEPGEGTFLPLTRAAAPTPVRQWTAEEAAEAQAAIAF